VTRLRSASLLLVALIACGRSSVNPGGSSGQDLTPLPDQGFRVLWISHDVPRTLTPRQQLHAHVTLKNISNSVWQGEISGSSDVRYTVALGLRFTRPGAIPGGYDQYGRFHLPHSLAPGQTTTVPVIVRTPANIGAYQLQFDLVQEHVAWFESRGATRLVVPLEVR
jgi:hypothetical protein